MKQIHLYDYADENIHIKFSFTKIYCVYLKNKNKKQQNLAFYRTFKRRFSKLTFKLPQMKRIFNMDPIYYTAAYNDAQFVSRAHKILDVTENVKTFLRSFIAKC